MARLVFGADIVLTYPRPREHEEAFTIPGPLMGFVSCTINVSLAEVLFRIGRSQKITANTNLFFVIFYGKK